MARQISACVPKLSTPLTAASLMLDKNTFLCDESFNSVVQACPAAHSSTQRVLDQAKQQADDVILCEIMCCCTGMPSISAEKGQSGKQQCVDDVMTESQRQQDGESRYRSEIDFDMKKTTQDDPNRKTEDPTPIVHRDPVTSEDTYYKTTYLPGRTDEVEGFKAKQGYIRRPDVVIVRDRKKQASVDNIERVVEMKFKDDPENKFATKDYRRIASGKKNYEIMKEGEEEGCICDDDGDKILEPLAARAAAVDKQTSSDTTVEGPSTGARAGYAVLGYAGGDWRRGRLPDTVRWPGRGSRIGHCHGRRVLSRLSIRKCHE